MRDVVKTNVKRDNSSKRVRRRNRHTKLYFFLVLIVVLGVGVLLSVTLLFNVKKINVNDDGVNYSKDNIIKASGIDIGDNMVRLDADAAEKRILSSMIYVEEAEINKKYPDTLEITLKKCVPSANAEHEGGILLLSPKGKILENVSEAQADLMLVKGLDLTSFNQGEYITSEDEQKIYIYNEILNALKSCKNSNVVSIDMTDKYDIIINYDNRINFEAGNQNEIAYKIKLADTVLKDIKEDKKGTMVMIGANQISFRSENAVNNDVNESQRVPINIDDMPEGYTQATDTSEEAYTEETYSEEQYVEENYEEGNYEEENYEPEYYEEEYQEDYMEQEYYDEGYYEDEFYEEEY